MNAPAITEELPVAEWVANQITELFSGFSIESLPKLRRWQNGSTRFYFRETEDGFKFYPSVTTVIGAGLPAAKQLLDWREAQEDPDAITQERADYGTLMHICAADYVKKTLVKREKYSKSDLDRCFNQFRVERELTWDLSKWPYDLRDDIYAWAKFTQDYRFEPLLIENTLCDEVINLAGSLDQIGFIWCDEKGKPGCESKKPIERVLAIIDLKSGRKAFWESHPIQLCIYRELFIRNYPYLPTPRIFNWRPAEWTGANNRKMCNYYLTEQTHSEATRLVPAPLLNIESVEFWRLVATMGAARIPDGPKVVYDFDDIDPDANITDAVRRLSPLEFLTKN